MRTAETLASILKRIARRFNAKRQHLLSEKLFVAAFGKHPGWDDHIDDIGLETDDLAAAKRVLYVQGIGGNIDSGSWDRLQNNQLIQGFKHAFVWWLADHTIVGRMWSSRDGKGRTSYPMVVCVQCRQLPLQWVVKNILPRLEGVEQSCMATTSAAEVLTIIANAQRQLRELAGQCQESADSLVAYPDALVRLAEYPELGPDRQGLHRILYHIEREVMPHQTDTAKTKVLRPMLLRVPASPTAAIEMAVLWISLLLAKFGTTMSVLMLMPLRERWIDIIAGEPADSQLHCLRASPEMIPITSSIPYNMGAEFINKANHLIEDSRTGQTTQPKT